MKEYAKCSKCFREVALDNIVIRDKIIFCIKCGRHKLNGDYNVD